MAPTADLNRTTTVNRPRYREMVKAAITSLADKKGSSRQAIMKYIMGTYGVAEDGRSKALVRTALIEGVKCGDLIQPKGTGASGSFKIGKKAAEPKAKKQSAKRPKKEAPRSQKKESKKTVAKEDKVKTKTKTKTEQKPKPRKISERDPKNPPKSKAGAKMTKQKKPPNIHKTPKAAKVKPVKPAESPKSPEPTAMEESMSPLKAVTKVKAKLLFSSTPSKKKNGKISKLLTPKRVVVKTKQTVKKSQKKKAAETEKS